MIDYEPHDWKRHIFAVRGSGLRQIAGRVLSCVAWATIVTVVYELLLTYYKFSMSISSIGHTLIGVALGLLLVFRTNASYDRFWEGRKLWGSIINETRNLGRAASAVLAAAPDLYSRLLAWTSVFANSAMHHLRDEKELGPAAARLPADETAAALQRDHVPLEAARQLSRTLAEAKARGVISDYVQMTLDQNVQQLIDYLGGCERIRKTPMPFAYMVHLRRALVLYCFSLPFAIVRDFGWGTIPATFLLAYVLLGIEEIGVEIEDPFGYDDNDLPLDRFCATIDRNLAELEKATLADPAASGLTEAGYRGAAAL